MSRGPHTPRSSAARHRGAAALAMTLLLLCAMTLLAGMARRQQAFELRVSSHQVRAAQAFEAAEAGLEWATAMLDGERTVDERCAAAVSGQSFRERFLSAETSPRVRMLTVACSH